MLRGICLGLAGLAAAGALSLGCLATPAAAARSSLTGQAIERKVDAATDRCAYVDADADGVCDHREVNGCGSFADADADGACDHRENGTCTGRGCGRGHHSGRGCGSGVRSGRGGAHRCW